MNRFTFKVQLLLDAAKFTDFAGCREFSAEAGIASSQHGAAGLQTLSPTKKLPRQPRELDL
jgi:hypothetical protein